MPVKRVFRGLATLKRRVEASEQRLRVSRERNACTHISRFEHPRALSVLIDLVPVPKSYERSTGDVL